MKRTILAFGALAGGIVVLYSILIFLWIGDPAEMSVDQLELATALGYIRYLVLLLGVVMAMIAFRRRTEGSISYGRILALGVGVAATTAVIVGGLEMAYVYARPDFFDNYTRLAEQAMRAEKGVTDADIKAFREHQENFSFMKSPVAMGAFYFLETLVVGSVFALVAAAFLRRPEESAGSVAVQP